jgi:hypothetical protein
MFKVVVLSATGIGAALLEASTILEGLPKANETSSLTVAVSTRKVVFLQTTDKSKTVFAIGPVAYGLVGEYRHDDIVQACNDLLEDPKFVKQDIRGGGRLVIFLEAQHQSARRVWTAHLYESSDCGPFSPEFMSHTHEIADVLGIAVRLENVGVSGFS